MPENFYDETRPGWSLDLRDPDVIRLFIPALEWLYQYYFRVETRGWHHIPKHQNVMLVGSHNGGLAAPDLFMMMVDWFRLFGCDRPAFGLMHPSAWKVLPDPLAQLAAQFGGLRAHPQMARAALQQGATVLIYPGGPRDLFRPHRQRNEIFLDGDRAFIKLALQEKVPIIPVISHGAHDTLIVLEDFYPIFEAFRSWGVPWLFDVDPIVFPVYLGLPWGLGIGPLPNIPFPVKIHTQVCQPITFDWYGKGAASDREYVEFCYQQVHQQMQQDLDSQIQSVDA